jgi:ankyrin repeat protein
MQDTALETGHPQGRRYLERRVAACGTVYEYETLLKYGFHVDGMSTPAPIELAAAAGNHDVLKLLLEKGAKLQRALECTVINKRLDLTRLILDKRPDTDVDPPPADTNEVLHDLLEFKKCHKIRLSPQSEFSYLQKNSGGALAVAIKRQEKEFVTVFLDHLAQFLKRRRPGLGFGLLQAVSHQDQNTVQLLLRIYGFADLTTWGQDERLMIRMAAERAVQGGDRSILDTIITETSALSHDCPDFLYAVSMQASI